jgi:phosphonate transport system permease protein
MPDVEQFDGEWNRPSIFPRPEIKYGISLLVFIYVFTGFALLGFSPARLLRGLASAGPFVVGVLSPAIADLDPIIEGTVSSIRMAVLGTAFGIAFSIPIGFFAASNLAPKPVYVSARLVIGGIRAFHGLIMAIVFVKMFGLGAFAGTLTLVIKSIGFLGKLLAEEIENIRDGELEAIRSTGATWPVVWLYAVYPQVYPRIVGLGIYRADSNLRASTILGIVGAGGIGSVLLTAMNTYQYSRVSTVLLVIIAMVLLGEYTSTYLRARLI